MMDKLQIIGKATLRGSITIPGSKNAALPIMVASLLSKNGLYLENLPALQDISTMKQLLGNFGIKTYSSNDSLKIFGNPKVKIKKILHIFANNDHRIAMAFFFLGQILNGKVMINNFETVNT